MPAHAAWVLAWAQRLRRAGVDAWIDQFEPWPPQGWPQRMRQQVARADKIVLVWTATYRRRYEGREEPGVGRGVRYEAVLADELAYDGARDKLVPVLVGDAHEDHIPSGLRSGTYHRLSVDGSDDDAFNELLRRLLDEPAVRPDPLGQITPRSAGMGTAPAPRDELAQLIEQRHRAGAAHADTREIDSRIRTLKTQLRKGSQPDPGYVLGDRYTLVERIGGGGFGTVWRAWQRLDTARGRDVAVKILHGHLVSEASRLRRFRRGADVMAELDDPTSSRCWIRGAKTTAGPGS